LDYGVVVAAALVTHAAGDVAFLEKRLEVIAEVSHTAV
jgi:hypothetical protein